MEQERQAYIAALLADSMLPNETTRHDTMISHLKIDQARSAYLASMGNTPAWQAHQLICAAEVEAVEIAGRRRQSQAAPAMNEQHLRR